MGTGADQKKVIGEVWSDERVQEFLTRLPGDDMNPDYFVLLEAYQHMLAHDYERFVQYFVAAGRDLNALGPDGQTFFQRVKAHRRATDYAAALSAAGAQ